MKPIEQTRREFLRAAGKGVLGAAALTAIPSVLKPALAETAASPAYPWTYQQVDKDAVLKHTYDCFYSHGGCCAAVFAGIMETMGDAYGAPYNVLNGKMFANGAAGWRCFPVRLAGRCLRGDRSVLRGGGCPRPARSAL